LDFEPLELPETSLFGAWPAGREPGATVGIGEKELRVPVEIGGGMGSTFVSWREEPRIETQKSGDEENEKRSGNEDCAPIGVEKWLVHRESR
jgi:hypothetical protein